MNDESLQNIELKVAMFEKKFNIDTMNDDTLAAIMVIERNITVLKNRVHKKSILTKHEAILYMIHNQFPHMNQTIITKELRKHHIYTRRNYLSFFSSLIVLCCGWFGWFISDNVPHVIISIVVSFGISCVLVLALFIWNETVDM